MQATSEQSWMPDAEASAQSDGVARAMEAEQDELQLEAEELLEFDRVRETVVGHARMAMSKEAIAASHPAWHQDDVERLQDETAEARELLESKGDIGMAGLPDVREALRYALLGGVLSASEILSVRAVYESMWTVKSIVERMGDRTPLLASHADLIHDLRHISGDVDHALSPNGDILDRATRRLGRLRQRMTRSYRRLVEMLERFVHRPEIRSALQSNVVASRNDRLVLEVKSSHRSVVPGVVHGVSGSRQTVFVEPSSAVDLGNQWRESAAEAQLEEEAVLRALSATIATTAEDGLASLQAAASIDIAMSRARYAVATESSRVSMSATDADATRVGLVDARHPLLGDEAVPVSLRMDAGQRGLVITGPNTGGKTVAMKTLGLFALMHQSGMQLPCNEATTLPIFNGIYADIGDAQSIDRSVSTFSSHMQRVVKISQRIAEASKGTAPSDALVLLDELGTGTDMEEGSALARAILDDLVARGAWVCVTTHHRTVAEFASAHAAIQNASVEVDSDTMMPNYNLIMGAPGRSYALHVAKRLGISDEVLEHAEGMIDPNRETAEMYLDRVREDALRERETLAELQREATNERAVARDLAMQAQAELEQALQERVAMVEQAREQLLREAQGVRRQLRRTIKETESQKSWSEARREVDETIRPLRSQEWMAREDDGTQSEPVAATSSASESAEPLQNGQVREDAPESPDGAPSDTTQGELRVGSLVRVPSLGIEGRVTSFGADGRATVSAGPMQFEANVRQMELVEEPEDDQGDGDTDTEAPLEVDPVYMPTADLDIRGSTVQVVESVLRQFIDRAFLQGLTSVRIIHGRGSGALREAVRDVLARESQVSAWRNAPPNQGGDAATIATLG